MGGKEEIFEQLMSMGYSEAKCRQALRASNSTTVEAALEWLFAHADDPDEDMEEAKGMETDKTNGYNPGFDPEKARFLAEKLQGLLDQVKVPRPQDKVYRDECVYTFDDAECPGGLYVCMRTFRGVGRRMLAEYAAATGQRLFVNVVKRRVPCPEEEVQEVPKTLRVGPIKPKYTIVEEATLHVLPEDKSLCDACDPSLPEQVLACTKVIMVAELPTFQAEVETWTEKREVSKYAYSLQQVNHPHQISPTGHQCAVCGLAENLWMNLTDGVILCGRRNFDGTGGNNHAADHYKKTSYPLAVKLGTITAEGADVFSYGENDMVEDPMLAQHLAHFGLDMTMLEKTEKTMTELDVERNLSYQWNLLEERGHVLQPVFGPGHTGMVNLGNSCYMATVLQVLFSLRLFVDAYYNARAELLQRKWDNVAVDEDFHVQMAKVADGLLSGCYSAPPENDDEEQKGIRPIMFKALIGKGHTEFSTMRQQDALEFFQYLMETIKQQERAAGRQHVDPSDAFRFEVEERLECMNSHLVRYSRRPDNFLSMVIPTQTAAATPKAVDAAMDTATCPSLPHVSLRACLENFAAPEELSGWISPATLAESPVLKTLRFVSFPQYLMVHMRRFGFSRDGTQSKLDVAVDMPEVFDLTHLKATGLQPGEQELPEEVAEEPLPAAKAVMDTLQAAGFSANATRRACEAAKAAGAATDAQWAMNWLLQHIEDPDLNDPLPSTTPGQPQAAAGAVSTANLEALQAMGFSEAKARKALEASSHNVERAVDWLFSHIDDPDPQDNATDKAHSNTYRLASTTSGRYELVGFISHMGKSTAAGHYVAHIKKNGRYVLFNDLKVALSQDPPIRHGYLYVYRRLD